MKKIFVLIIFIVLLFMCVDSNTEETHHNNILITRYESPVGLDKVIYELSYKDKTYVIFAEYSSNVSQHYILLDKYDNE